MVCRECILRHSCMPFASRCTLNTDGIRHILLSWPCKSRTRDSPSALFLGIFDGRGYLMFFSSGDLQGLCSDHRVPSCHYYRPVLWPLPMLGGIIAHAPEKPRRRKCRADKGKASLVGWCYLAHHPLPRGEVGICSLASTLSREAGPSAV